MGFGCNVPAVMAIKSFETRKEQVIVAMMSLFMSCGARLPVYTLLISAFIPKTFQGVTLFGIYVFGIFTSFLTGKFLSAVYQRGKNKRLITYEMSRLVFPSYKKAIYEGFQKGKAFIRKVGVFILPITIILWGIFTFPLQNVEKYGIESSYGASLGKMIQPVFAPMHFDWKISTALLSGIAAKEVMVTTFAELYHAEDTDESLQQNIRNAGVFTFPVAIALLVFILLYTPCMAVIGTIRGELGNFWAGFSILYPFVFAWIVSFLTFHIVQYISLL